MSEKSPDYTQIFKSQKLSSSIFRSQNRYVELDINKSMKSLQLKLIKYIATCILELVSIIYELYLEHLFKYHFNFIHKTSRKKTATTNSNEI